MRLIDADKLEREGWHLVRTINEYNTISQEWKDIKSVETVRQTCEPLHQGDIVRNNNNNTYGVVIALMDDKHAAQILELSGKEKRMFINCPPLAALEKTGKHLTISRLIMEQVNS